RRKRVAEILYEIADSARQLDELPRPTAESHGTPRKRSVGVLQRRLEGSALIHSECRGPLAILRRTVRRSGTDNSAPGRPEWAGTVRSIRPQFRQVDESEQWCGHQLADTNGVCRAQDVQTWRLDFSKGLQQFRTCCRLRLGTALVWKRKNERPRRLPDQLHRRRPCRQPFELHLHNARLRH